jgi:hypothetical protein
MHVNPGASSVCLRKVDRGGGNHRCGHEICGQCRIKTIQERERAKKLQESILKKKSEGRS